MGGPSCQNTDRCWLPPQVIDDVDGIVHPHAPPPSAVQEWYIRDGHDAQCLSVALVEAPGGASLRDVCVSTAATPGSGSSSPGVSTGGVDLF
jgi:hypothetical protein